jgi:hypothetical protein
MLDAVVINAINVASLYVAVRRPVSKIATTRWPSNNGSTGSAVGINRVCPPACMLGS